MNIQNKVRREESRAPLELVLKEVRTKTAESSSANGFAGKRNEVRREESRAPPRSSSSRKGHEVLPRKLSR
ncbi:hypothetical protein COCNU_06G012680 [Cocos nucifera]|uniref:Uncharacterized protein n=1 Tax=Cocos nucifera TaxID=13894 RepID=A0A8K0N3G6_COCNU|nr:hypothetical protein COCNU_06G012680 [Cocos nucifera]